jgi:hypothetical protein
MDPETNSYTIHNMPKSKGISIIKLDNTESDMDIEE